MSDDKMPTKDELDRMVFSLRTRYEMNRVADAIESLRAALAKREAVAEVPKDAPQSFITYMKQNYPPDTIIQDGAWHARAIWGAARYAMLAASQQAAKGEGT